MANGKSGIAQPAMSDYQRVIIYHIPYRIISWYIIYIYIMVIWLYHMIYIYIMVIWLYHMILPINHHESHCLLHPYFCIACICFPSPSILEDTLKYHQLISPLPQGRAVHLSAAACHRRTPSTWGAESQTRAAVLRTMVLVVLSRNFHGKFHLQIGILFRSMMKCDEICKN